jgi:hypothetical protein
MNQRDLNRDVAQATGETVETIARMGFSPLRVPFEQDPEEYAVDWDELEAQRCAETGDRHEQPASVARATVSGT